MSPAWNGSNTVYAPAAAWTDLLDYHPNSTALINGTGFAVGETVQLQVLHTDGTPSPGDAPWFVVDGGASDRDGQADGNFQTTLVRRGGLRRGNA